MLEIPKRMKWDGDLIDLTKNCEGCQYRRENGPESICGWGVSWKILRKKMEATRSCSKLKQQNDKSSIAFLDEVLKPKPVDLTLDMFGR